MSKRQRGQFGILISCAFGYLVGSIFKPEPFWITVAVLVGYHVFLAWLVMTSEHQRVIPRPTLLIIFAHLACLATIVVASNEGFYKQFINIFFQYALNHPFAIIFVGLARYSPLLIVFLAYYEYEWLFMGPMKVEEFSATTPSETTEATNLSPTPELRKLYLEVVNQVHPDRASNEQDRVLREGLTKEANAAFKQGNDAAMRQVLEKYESLVPQQ